MALPDRPSNPGPPPTGAELRERLAKLQDKADKVNKAKLN